MTIWQLMNAAVEKLSSCLYVYTGAMGSMNCDNTANLSSESPGLWNLSLVVSTPPHSCRVVQLLFLQFGRNFCEFLNQITTFFQAIPLLPWCFRINCLSCFLARQHCFGYRNVYFSRQARRKFAPNDQSKGSWSMDRDCLSTISLKLPRIKPVIW